MKSISKYFIIGVITHIAYWAVATNFDSTPYDFACAESSCWLFMLSELPFSMFYGGSAEAITKGSLIFGTLWWGVLFLMMGCGWTALIRWAAKSNKNESISIIQANKVSVKGFLTCIDCEKTFYAEDCADMICPDCKGTLKP